MVKRKSKARALSTSTRKPPRTGGDSSVSDRQLVSVTPPASSLVTNTGFSLPAGWRVEEVFRSDRSKFDRYYFEPDTGKKFRSLKDVERHLNGEEVKRIYISGNRPESSSPRKMIVHSGKVLNMDEEEHNPNHWAIVPSGSAETPEAPPCQLPDGWVVEEVPRQNENLTDKYYYEPGTGRKFRSMVSVQKHLSELTNENRPLSKMFKVNHNMTTASKPSREEESSFGEPPLKVKWVLGNRKGDVWNAFIDDKPVSDSVKEEWRKRFLSSMENS
ncbi:unnamed protein product [Cuscuta epithymum]|uniref:MBD domain-containing protein n=1 Tax=Cuscuta epithymum TaxID=186058 RepID=A0AAV0F4M5_9ASTE|nr:unnamed protein product [Cuscuta epithymum]